jgi:hypothetical protein
MRSLLWALIGPGLVLTLAGLASAGDASEGMPPIEKGFLVTLRPGERVEIVVSFKDFDQERAVGIWDQQRETFLAGWNNYYGGVGAGSVTTQAEITVGANQYRGMYEGKWVSHKNETDRPQTLLIYSICKSTYPPEATKVPWVLGKVGLLDQTEASRLIGCDNPDGGKFNRAVVTVKWVQ